MRGATLQVGDIILYRNIVMKVTDISGGLIHKIEGVKGNQAKAQVTPAILKCSIEFATAPDQLVEGLFKLTQPEEKAEIDANNNRIGGNA